MSLSSSKANIRSDSAPSSRSRRGRAPSLVRRRGRPRKSPDDTAAMPAAEVYDERLEATERKRRYAEDSSNFLAKYFRDMSALDVMPPQQEFESARKLEALELAIWSVMLSYAGSVDYVVALIEMRLDNSANELKSLRRVASAARRSPTKAHLTKLERAAERAALALRSMDTDRETMEALLADLQKLGRGAPPRAAVKPPRQSAALRAWLSRVAAAERAAEVARNAFVLANLRLVVSIARRFNHGRMALADLIQEGNIGLMKAVERYDYRKGFRFSTYASWWIRHAISRALADKGREVRLPVHMIDAYHRLSRARRELAAKLGRQATVEELSAATDIPAGKIEKMRSYLAEQSVSLDKPVSDEDGRTLLDILQEPVDDRDGPAERMTLEAQSEEVRQLLCDLKPIEADILRQRFGFDDDRELTLKEIGEKYNLSRERIRQLQEQALGKMRKALLPEQD